MPPVPGAPALGVHALSYNFLGLSPSRTLGARLARTPDSGSTLLVSVGRGVSSAHAAPTDNKANVFRQVEGTHAYALWPKSGTALYACAQAAGGPDHLVSVSKAVVTDETTISVVEIVNAGVVVDAKWSEVLKGRPTTTETVTTTGPALIVAWWWGDADVAHYKTARPDNGFRVIDSVLRRGALVQCAVAVRTVATAGSYRTTWSATPAQGAQLWIAAVQGAA